MKGVPDFVKIHDYYGLMARMVSRRRDIVARKYFFSSWAQRKPLCHIHTGSGGHSSVLEGVAAMLHIDKNPPDSMAPNLTDFLTFGRGKTVLF